MKTTCPECDARFEAPAGRPVPCPGCGNPVVARSDERPRPRPREEAPAPAEASVAIPWAKALIVLIVLAVAHYGIYLLVSAGARSEVAAIEARQGGRIPARVEAPGDPPPASSPAYAGWLEQKERYDDVRAWREHEGHRAWVARGLGLAYLVQVVIMGFALARVASSMKRRTRAGGRSRG